jgi:hypothetical protein
MTIIALWYRREQDDIYAISDSRLSVQNGTLTDKAPKFSIININCFASGPKKGYNKKILDSKVAIGYCGSSSVAFSTIVAAQSYLSSLTIDHGKNLPLLSDVAELFKRILEENFLDFGILWEKNAKCDIVLFGSLPRDQYLKAFVISTNIKESNLEVLITDLPLREQDIFFAFGSAATFFSEKVRERAEKTKNFEPFNILSEILESGTRPDVGGAVQVAIAEKNHARLMAVLTPRLDRGSDQADVVFLGRELSQIGSVGECKVGRESVGPSLQQVLQIRAMQNK